MKKQDKKKGEVSLFDVIVRMSEGNPGALTVLQKLMTESKKGKADI